MDKKTVGIVRLSVGLLQGLALYYLHHAAEDNAPLAGHPMLFVPLLLIAFTLPTLAIFNMGQMAARTLSIWGTGCGVAMAGLGVYDVARRGLAGAALPLWTTSPLHPSASLTFAAFVGVFIAQSLIFAADQEKKYIASYPRYFDVAWKLCVQWVFSAAFLALFWAVMFMGVALFGLVHIDFLKDLLKHDWFDIPISTLAFTYAVGLTDVRANIVRGIRTLKLILLSWLLPIMTGFAAIFTFSLPFKGLDILWATHHTSQIMLGAASWLILLINAAYQDGTEETRPGRILQWSARIGAVLLVPFMGVAWYALSLRVGEYGWTVALIDVLACLIVASCYAGGYAWASVNDGAWLRDLERTNIYASFVIIGVLLALFTPLADPARLSVADQMNRFEKGRVTADKFDFNYLARQGGVYGMHALDRLKGWTQGEHPELVREKAQAAIDNANKPIWAVNAPKQPEKEMKVYPESKNLPDSFKNKNWDIIPTDKRLRFPGCLFNKTIGCDAFLVESADAEQKIIVALSNNYGVNYLFAFRDGDWVPVGSLSHLLNCAPVHDALQKGDYRLVPVEKQALEVGGMHIPVEENQQCSEK